MKSRRVVPFLPYCAPGASSFSPAWPARSTAAPMTAERLNPKSASTQTVMIPAPAMSSTALMICTQVVPRMPPIST